MGISIVIAKIRFMYHANAWRIVIPLWQLKIISGEKANELNKHHIMECIDAMQYICPKAYKKLFKETES